MADNDMTDYEQRAKLAAALVAQGYRAGLAAALKALEEWRDKESLMSVAGWNDVGAAAADHAARIVKALIEEKP